MKALFAVAALSIAPLGMTAEPPKAGDKAPDFTLKTCNGEPTSLTDLLKRGNVLLLFFRGTW